MIDLIDDINGRSARASVNDIKRKENDKKNMDSTGITPVMPVNGGDGMFGNGFMGIFGLLILVGLLNGGFGGFGGNAQQYATSAEVQRGFDTQNMQANTAGILNAVTNGTAQTIAASTANATNAINAIKDGNAALIREFGTVETALTSLAGQMQNCCCENRMAIMQNNYDGAMRDAATNANFTAQIQSVKDMIAQNKIENLQAQVSALQLQAATSNIVRFPNSYTFNGGTFPPAVTAA